MRLDFDDEIRILADALRGDARRRAAVGGACWVIGRALGVPAEQIVARVDALVGSQTGPQAPVVPVAQETDYAPFGYFMVPGFGGLPITELAEDPMAANLDEPPASESTSSFAARHARALAERRPEWQPMDPEMLAEVEAEMEAARKPR